MQTPEALEVLRDVVGNVRVKYRPIEKPLEKPCESAGFKRPPVRVG